MDFSSAYSKIKIEYSYDLFDDTAFFTLPAFKNTGLVKHGFSSRLGGVSGGCFSSLNLSFTRVEDSRENVMQNYRIFAKNADIAWERMVMDTFEHGNNVLRVNADNAGAGYLRPSLPYCDALITNDPSIALVTGHADCLPLFFLDCQNKAVGLAHAGHKGTFDNIAANVISLMQEQFNTEPDCLLCGIGPCICRDCFEVDISLMHSFRERFADIPFYKSGKPGKAHIDLAMITVSQFLACSVPPENITLMGVCTYEDEQRLYSYRRDKGKTGGMAAYIQLNQPSPDSL